MLRCSYEIDTELLSVEVINAIHILSSIHSQKISNRKGTYKDRRWVALPELDLSEEDLAGFSA